MVRVVRRNPGGAALPVRGAQVRAVGTTQEWLAVTDELGEAEFPAGAEAVRALWVAAADAGSRRIAPARLGAETLVIELAAGAPVRLVFQNERGDVVRPSDARKRYERTGCPATLRVLAETALDGGLWNDRESPLLAAPGGWQTEATLVWSDSSATAGVRLAPGRWRLLVPRPSADPFLSDVLVARDGEDLVATVTLPDETATRVVRFLDAADGSPLSGAKVTPWYTLVKDYAHAPGMSVCADEEGTASIPRPATGARDPRPVWSVESGECAVEFDEGLVGSAGPPPDQPLVIRVPRVAVVEGTAYSAPGVPAAGAQVSWASRNGPAVRTVCGPDGRFRLPGIRLRRGLSETASVCLTTDQGMRFHAVDITAGATSQVVLGPQAGASGFAAVAGRVTAGGRPLAGLQVVLAPLADPRTLMFAVTGHDGRYRFDSILAGTAKMRVVCGDPRVSDAFKIATTTPLRVLAAETTIADFDLPDAAVRVTVIDAATGAPIEGARVMASPLDARDHATRFPGAVFVPGSSAYTDASGCALLSGVVAGAPHRIEASDGSGRVQLTEDAVPGTVDAPSEVRLALRR